MDLVQKVYIFFDDSKILCTCTFFNYI